MTEIILTAGNNKITLQASQSYALAGLPVVDGNIIVADGSGR